MIHVLAEEVRNTNTVMEDLAHKMKFNLGMILSPGILKEIK